MNRTLATIGFSFVAAQSMASLTQVGSALALGANDSIDWAQFGLGTTIGSGTAGLTTNGHVFQVWSVDAVARVYLGNSFRVLDDGGVWCDGFGGDAVLYQSEAYPADILITFANAVGGVGYQVETNASRAFNAWGGYYGGAPYYTNAEVGSTFLTGVGSLRLWGQQPLRGRPE